MKDSRHRPSLAIFALGLRTARRFAEQVKIENMVVNSRTTCSGPHVPFGGYKASGLRYKEERSLGLRFCSKGKTIVMDGG